MLVAFKYSDAPLTDLTFSETAENQVILNPLSFLRPKLTTAVSSGTMLNGRSYAHTLYSRLIYNIIISADALNTTILPVLERFWAAPVKYISWNSELPSAALSSYRDYVEVICDGGDLPIEYVNGASMLPEITLKLARVAPLPANFTNDWWD